MIQPIRKFGIKWVSFVLFSASLYGAAGDVKLSQQATNGVSWKDAVLTPQRNSLLLFDHDLKPAVRELNEFSGALPPLTESEILQPCGYARDDTWTETNSSFSGGTVLAWSDVPAQVYSNVSPDTLLLMDDSLWWNGGEGLGGPVQNQAAYAIAYEWEFDLTADAFEVWFHDRRSVDYTVLVDGQVVGSGNCRVDISSGVAGFQKISFPTWTTRRIAIICDDQVSGIAIPAQATISKPARKTRTRCVVMGDSITEAWQTPTGPLIGGFAHRLRHHFGWEVYASGSGGTGYLQTNGDRVKLRDRLAQDCYVFAPDIVVVAMGTNGDVSTEAARTAMADEAALCFADIKVNLPRARVVVLSPHSPYTPNANVLDMGAKIQAKAAAAGFSYVNMLGWFTDANHGRYFTISNDNTHPDLLGHAYMASRLARELYALKFYRDSWLSSPGTNKRHDFGDITARSITTNNQWPLRVGVNGTGEMWAGKINLLGSTASLEMQPRSGVGSPVVVYSTADGNLNFYANGRDVVSWDGTGAFTTNLITQAGRQVHVRDVSDMDWVVDSNASYPDEYLFGGNETNARTVTLPTASTKTGRRITVGNRGNALITVDATSRGQISGWGNKDGYNVVNTAQLRRGETLSVVSDGVTWWVVDRNVILGAVAYSNDYWMLQWKATLTDLGINSWAGSTSLTTAGNLTALNLKIGNIPPEHADNAAALAAGLTNGSIYRTGDVLKIVHP